MVDVIDAISVGGICFIVGMLFVCGVFGIGEDRIIGFNAKDIAEQICEQNNAKLLEYEFHDGDEQYYESIVCINYNSTGVFELIK